MSEKCKEQKHCWHDPCCNEKAPDPEELLTEIAIERSKNWVSVDNKLPKYGLPYLLKGRHSATPFVKYIYHHNDLEEFCVTHWMPLPKPPKEESDE